MPKKVDIKGQRFNRLVALKVITDRPKGHLYWLFECDCGVRKEINGKHVRSGLIKSCGCYRNEVTKARATTHGMGKTKEYSIWCHIKRRTKNKSDKNLKWYKNIKMCKRWLKFENFLKDMGHIPPTCDCIDRLDNLKGYYKKNCRWASWLQSVRNRRISHNIKYKGVTRHLTEWAAILGVQYSTLKSRIYRYSWSIERAFTEKVRFR